MFRAGTKPELSLLGKTMRHFLITLILIVCVISLPDASADDGSNVRERLNSCNPITALAAAKQILNDPKTLQEPLDMFPPVLTLFQLGQKDDAVFWFYAAQLRTRYQLAFQNGDRGQLLSIMMMSAGPFINSYGLQDVQKLDDHINRVLEWDKSTPNPMRERPLSKDAKAQIEKIYSDLNDFRIKIRLEKDSIQKNAKTEAAQLGEVSKQMRASNCKK